MKNLLLYALLPVLFIAGIFTRDLIRKPAQTEGSTVIVGDTLLQQRVIGKLFSDNRTELEKATKTIAKKLQSNREFILTYFVERATSSSKIGELIGSYGSLLDLDFVELRTDSGKVIASYGVQPEKIAEQVDTTLFYKNSNNKQFEYITNTSVDFKRAKLQIIGAKYVTESEISSLSSLLEKELIFFEGDKLLLTTIPSIKSLNRKSDNVLLINSKEFHGRRVPFTIDGIDIMLVEQLNVKTEE